MREKWDERGMFRVYGASAFIAGAVIACAPCGTSGAGERSVLLSCVGMELVQNAAPDGGAPDDGAPDANSGTAPDDGSADGNNQSPGDDDGDGDEGGVNSDQAPPPGSRQPPGCIFRNEPLELLV